MIDNIHALKKIIDKLEEGAVTVGNAETAEKLKTSIKINGVDFDGSKDITITSAASGGNSDTATKLKTAREISLSGGATGTATAFDGSSDIAIPVTGLNMGNANAGILAVARGGTGQSSVQALRKSMGLGDTTGALPAANGGTGNTTGNAATATKLATARTIRTNLASTATASFNGTANVTPGVTGTLPVGNGGTGNTTGNASACNGLTLAVASAAPTAVTNNKVTFVYG